MAQTEQASALKVAILGCGEMGTALLKGWLKDKNTSQYTYAAHVRSATSQERLQQEFGTSSNVQITSGDDSLVRAATGSDLILIGVHPRDLGEFLRVPGLISQLEGKVLVSMLAGVSTTQIQDSLNATASESGIAKQEWPLARIIPTLGVLISESVTLLASDPAVTDKPEHIKTFERLFSPLGAIHHVPERLMNEATAVGAAVSALAITAIDAATDASVADGVPRSIALALAAQTLRSCSGLMLHGGMSPEQVKAAMSTPAGITLNSIVKLEDGTRAGIAGTVRNAISYTRAMSG